MISPDSSAGPGAERFFTVPCDRHNALVEAVYRKRGYHGTEGRAAARVAADATWHGVRTHNAIKALEIEAKHREYGGGSVPGARVRHVVPRFPASEVWDARRKLGPAVAFAAIDRCMTLADRYGVGQVCVDSACHYLWGGAYVLRAARRGYIAYTNCTASLAEVVPFQGRTPTLGTNPHSWAFPTQHAVGFPVLIDWATSVIAMSRVGQLRRERQKLPSGAAVDAAGRPTIEPDAVAALLPIAGHKGYGLSLVNELVAAFIGGSLPTLRNRGPVPNGKHTSAFFFQVIHPEAVTHGAFAGGITQIENVRAVLQDIRGHGNEDCLLPGQIEAEASARSHRNGGLLFTAAEVTELNRLANECGAPRLDPAELPVAT